MKNQGNFLLNILLLFFEWKNTRAIDRKLFWGHMMRQSHYITGKDEKCHFQENGKGAHLRPQKKAFLKTPLSKFEPIEMGGNFFLNILLPSLECKNIRAIDYKFFWGNMRQQLRYMTEKGKKSLFFENDKGV